MGTEDRAQKAALGMMFWVWSWAWLMEAHVSGQVCGTVEAELNFLLSKGESTGAL